MLFMTALLVQRLAALCARLAPGHAARARAFAPARDCAHASSAAARGGLRPAPRVLHTTRIPPARKQRIFVASARHRIRR
jgi:hypothetical protein